MSYRLMMYGDISRGYFTNKTIRDFGGLHRKVYRLLMIKYFAASQHSNFERFTYAKQGLDLMNMALLLDRVRDIEKEKLQDYELNCAMYLHYDCAMKLVKEGVPVAEDFIDEENLLKAASFYQNYASNLERGQTLYEYKDLEPFWDLKKIYGTMGIEILEHHWFDFSIFESPVPVLTFPEFFAYQDLINIWNVTLEQEEITKGLGFRFDSSESRQAKYSYVSSLRTSLILGIQFFETYLFYLYYNLRAQGKFPKNSLINRTNVKTVSDEQIIDQLLYVEFPHLETKLTELDKKFREALKDRNAYVHMSAFQEDHTNVSRMQRLVNLNVEIITDYLQTMIEMMVIIEDEIEDNKILFWWSRVEYPNFKSRTKICSLINN